MRTWTPSMILAAALASASCGGGSSNPATPADTTAPTTTASPPGGPSVHATAFTVVLTANEPAIIYYTLGGSVPVPGQPGTYGGPSPLTTSPLPEGTIVLSYFAADASGNREVPHSETYLVDLTAPAVTPVGAAPAPLAWLDVARVSFTNSEAGTWKEVLGGDGTPGSGEVIAAGTASAPGIIDLQLEAFRLVFGAPAPVWLQVTDDAGHTGSASVTLQLRELMDLPVAVGPPFDPSGSRAYAGGNAIGVLDTNPASATFHQVVGSFTAGGQPLALSPDGSRLYAQTSNTQAQVVSTATGNVVAGPVTVGSSLDGFAITPDGGRIYAATFDYQIRVLDPADLSLKETITSLPLIDGAGFAFTPDSRRMLVTWYGLIALGVDLFDVDPSSPTYHYPLATPLGPVQRPPSRAVAISSDGLLGYAPAPSGGLGKVDLSSGNVLASAPVFTQQTVALTPDDRFLMACNSDAPGVTLVRTGTMEVLATLADARVGGRCGVTPDGTRLYTGGTVAVPLR